MSVKATCIYELVGNTLVFVHTKAEPTEAEWTGWLERMSQHDYRSIIVSTDGGGPTLAQRKQADQSWTDNKVSAKLAVISESLTIRGIITAFNWLGHRNIKAFSASDIVKAFEFSETPVGERGEVLAKITIMKSRLHGQREASLAPNSTDLAP